MPEKKHILFVDDEPSVLAALRRMLRPMQHDWETASATSGQEALELMAQQPFDVIVSDMRMPKMNGAQLLEQVQRRYPQVVRLILSGYSDQELILRSVGPAHQFLAKPCDADTLIATVKRSCALRERLSGQRLRQIVARIGTLPGLPTVYAELVRALGNEDVSMVDVGKIVAKDVSMTARILQVINSAFFGLRQQIEDPSRAVYFLGLDTVKGLVLSISAFSEFDASTVREFSVEALHQHCLRVGAIARRIAVGSNLPRQVQSDAFTAGILHGIGRLILAASFPDELREAAAVSLRRGIRLVDAEIEILGTTHAELGGYLLESWGLPDPIVEAVAFYPTPQESPIRAWEPLALVHVANAMDREFCREQLPGGGFGYDMEYLSRLGMTGQLSHWRDIAAPSTKGKREEVPAGAGHGN